MDRIFNFSAGPATLPLNVLEQARDELTNWHGCGMSVMEMSHRGKEYMSIHAEAEADLRTLLGIPANYKVLFLQGGATAQFDMVPMNLLRGKAAADYLNTGEWSKKAIKEAKKFGQVNIVASSEDRNFSYAPAFSTWTLDPNAAYVHITSNETIGGVEIFDTPDTGNVPLVADMSSNILSRPIDVSKYGLIYAGAQKNLGPAGVTLVIIKKSFLATANPQLPTMLKYGTFAKDNSLYNTPPTFGIYLMGLVLDWIKQQGGLAAVTARNEAKAALIYDAIDASNGFYKGHAVPAARSRMNITFNLPNEELEKKFLAEAKQAGFVGLAGHRSVGGCRASAYNAVPVEACQALRDLMLKFQKENG